MSAKISISDDFFECFQNLDEVKTTISEKPIHHSDRHKLIARCPTKPRLLEPKKPPATKYSMKTGDQQLPIQTMGEIDYSLYAEPFQKKTFLCMPGVNIDPNRYTQTAPQYSHNSQTAPFNFSMKKPDQPSESISFNFSSSTTTENSSDNHMPAFYYDMMRKLKGADENTEPEESDVATDEVNTDESEDEIISNNLVPLTKNDIRPLPTPQILSPHNLSAAANAVYTKMHNDFHEARLVNLKINNEKYPIVHKYNPNKARFHASTAIIDEPSNDEEDDTGSINQTSKQNLDLVEKRKMSNLASMKSRNKKKEKDQNLAYNVEFANAKVVELLQQQKFVEDVIISTEEKLMLKGIEREKIQTLRDAFGIL